MNRNNGTDMFSVFFPNYFNSGAMISHNGGDIFSNFSALLSTTVDPLLTIAGYFTSETIMEVSEGNITIFLRSKKQMKRNLFIFRQHSCFPTMGAINSLRARDQEISCQS